MTIWKRNGVISPKDQAVFYLTKKKGLGDMKKEKPTAAPEGKSRYRQIIDGDKEPEGIEKGWKNLQPEKYDFRKIDKEKRREICRKGAQAVNRLHGEKKTAQQALENILSLKLTDEIIEGSEAPPEVIDRLKRSNPDATIYDLIQAVAAGRALGGSMAAIQYIRDTNGDKPQDRLEVSNNIMTDQDRQLMQQISDRLQKAELTIIEDQGSD